MTKCRIVRWLALMPMLALAACAPQTDDPEKLPVHGRWAELTPSDGARGGGRASDLLPVPARHG